MRELITSNCMKTMAKLIESVLRRTCSQRTAYATTGKLSYLSVVALILAISYEFKYLSLVVFLGWFASHYLDWTSEFANRVCRTSKYSPSNQRLPLILDVDKMAAEKGFKMRSNVMRTCVTEKRSSFLLSISSMCLSLLEDRVDELPQSEENLCPYDRFLQIVKLKVCNNDEKSFKEVLERKEWSSEEISKFCESFYFDVVVFVVQGSKLERRTTSAPITAAPVTQALVTQALVTSAPVTPKSVSQASVTQAPVTSHVYMSTLRSESSGYTISGSLNELGDMDEEFFLTGCPSLCVEPALQVSDSFHDSQIPAENFNHSPQKALDKLKSKATEKGGKGFLRKLQKERFTQIAIKDWSISNVSEWLRTIKMEKYIDQFVEKKIDGSDLIKEKEKLKSMLAFEIPKSDAKRIQNEIEVLQLKVNKKKRPRTIRGRYTDINIDTPRSKPKLDCPETLSLLWIHKEYPEKESLRNHYVPLVKEPSCRINKLQYLESMDPRSKACPAFKSIKNRNTPLKNRTSYRSKQGPYLANIRASNLDFDHIYIPFYIYLLAVIFVRNNLSWSAYGRLLLLKVQRIWLTLFGRYDIDYELACASFLLECSLSMFAVHVGKTEAIWVFENFCLPVVENSNVNATCQNYRSLKCKVDLKTKKLIEYELILPSGAIDEVSIEDLHAILVFMINGQNHPRIHSAANWGLNVESSNWYVRLVSIVSVLYNYLGWSAPDLFSSLYRVGFTSSQMKGALEACFEHAVLDPVLNHKHIRELLPHSRFVNFITKVRNKFMNTFEDHKNEDFAGINGEALFVGTIIHSLDHYNYMGLQYGPCDVCPTHPKFKAMGEVCQVITACLASELPFVVFPYQYRSCMTPFFKDVYLHAKQIDKELADAMDCCIIR